MTLLPAAALGAVWMLFALMLLPTGPPWKSPLIAAVTGEDADMKIAPDSFSAGRGEDTGAQDEAEDYLRQKSAGNIELARNLGERYAALLMTYANENFNPWPAEPALSLRAHHRLLLLTYVVNRAVTELSPSPILAQTTLNVFYSELDARAPELDKYIRDMASYSLYVLCERSPGCPRDEIGRIYARLLCADRDNPRLAEEGNHLFNEYYTACRKLHDQVRYVQV